MTYKTIEGKDEFELCVWEHSGIGTPIRLLATRSELKKLSSGDPEPVNSSIAINGAVKNEQYEIEADNPDDEEERIDDGNVEWPDGEFTELDFVSEAKDLQTEELSSDKEDGDCDDESEKNCGDQNPSFLAEGGLWIGKETGVHVTQKGPSRKYEERILRNMRRRAREAIVDDRRKSEGSLAGYGEECRKRRGAMESIISYLECSTCGGEFSLAINYRNHLQNCESRQPKLRTLEFSILRAKELL